MRAPSSRLVELVARPLSAEDRAWIVSTRGLVAACKEMVERRDTISLDAVRSSELWSHLADTSPHPLGSALARRGRAIVAAADLACATAPCDELDVDDDLDRIATGFGGRRTAPGLTGDATATARVAAADLVRWLSTSDRPPPRAVRRVTFLVDEHTRGRAVRLTLGHLPDATSFGQDVVNNPFTIVDDEFEAALADARAASGLDLGGVRWSVTWENGEVPLELQGRSVGLAALVCFDRLHRGDQLAVEKSWAFTGAVDRRGRILGCMDGVGERPFANKLRAAERRPVVVAADDLDRALRIADAGNLGVRLHSASDLDGVLALLDARKPPWLSADASPCFGRILELDQLEQLAARAEADGTTVACVTGEPGIGKSRLAREFATSISGRGWRIAWGACFEAEATATYRPAVAVIRSLLDWFDDPSDIIGDARDELAILFPELVGRRARRRRANLASDPQLACFDAVARVIGRAADAHPIIIVVEDVHWADRPSLLLLAHVVRHCAQRPLLLLVSYRHNEIGGEHPVTGWLADVRAAARVDELRLDGLDEAAIDGLLTELNGRQAPPQFTSSMLRVTHGNPLFIHELARHARASGALDPRRDQWNVQLDGAPLPAGLRDVLGRRIRALPRSAQELLRYIAVSPDGLTFDVLGVASGLDQVTLLDALDQAIEASVVRELRRDDIGVVFDFRHVLFRQVLAEQSSSARRASYHLALAHALSGLGDPSERLAGEIGYHLHRAGRLGDPRATVHACRRAGDLAMARTAYDDAATQFERAAEAAGWTTDVAPAAVAELELLAAEASHRAGNRERRRALAERAFDRARRSGDAVTAAGAALVHGGARSTYGLPSQVTMDMLEQGLVLLERKGTNRDLRARLVSRLAQETYHVQRFAEAKLMGAMAVELLMPESSAADRVAVLDGKAWTLHTPDDVQARLELADDMVRDAVHAEDPEWEMVGRSWRCTALLELGDVAGIDEELRRLDTLSRTAPVPSHLFRVATLRCTRAMMAGAFDEGSRLAQDAYRIGATIEPENALQTLCAQMIGMLREQGLLGALVDTAEQMVADFPMVPGWRCALAFVNLEADRPERARALFDELAAEQFAAVPRDLAWLQAHAYLAELAAAFDDEQAATVLYRLLKPFSGRNVGLYDIASGGAVDHYLGVLAATTRRRAVAVRHLHRAVVFNDATSQPPAAARSRVILAGILGRGDDRERERAAELLQHAAGTAAVLDLAALAKQVAALDSELTMV